MSGAIVLGLGDNIDYEIRWDSAVLERMIREYALSRAELNTPPPIKTQRDLLVSILGFLQAETGGERFVENIDIIEEFSRNFDKKITLGGTAVRAAITMRKMGHLSAVHLVTMNEHVRRLLPPDCRYFCSNTETSSYPHLIVQYSSGTSVRANDINIETKRANRIIYTNDEDNALMRLHPDLSSLLSGAKVFLISGFNVIKDTALLEDRLRFLTGALEKAPKEMIVFFEDACYHQAGISDIVRKYLLKYITIYSLNEDEFEGYLGRSVSWTSSQAVLEALKDLYAIIPAGTLVLHTRFWALAWGSKAADYREALLGGITMATTRFRFGDDFTPADYAETSKLPPEEAGRIFASEIQAAAGSMVCCVPSFSVKERNVTTIGLGDTFVGGFLPALIKI
jgi:ADP-dependent phosphofructokinase/glucokinase